MLQVRNIPEEIHRILKVRAASAGTSLSEYVHEDLRAMASRPTLQELHARIASRGPVKLKSSPADLIRQERDAR